MMVISSLYEVCLDVGVSGKSPGDRLFSEIKEQKSSLNLVHEKLNSLLPHSPLFISGFPLKLRKVFRVLDIGRKSRRTCIAFLHQKRIQKSPVVQVHISQGSLIPIVSLHIVFQPHLPAGKNPFHIIRRFLTEVFHLSPSRSPRLRSIHPNQPDLLFYTFLIHYPESVTVNEFGDF
jgi:hypothetical protein